MLDFTELSTESCCDFVTMFDGDNAKARMLITLSGVISPPPKGITSSQRYMYVSFVSDDSNHYRGFSATFSSVTTGEDFDHLFIVFRIHYNIRSHVIMHQ